MAAAGVLQPRNVNVPSDGPATPAASSRRSKSSSGTGHTAKDTNSNEHRFAHFLQPIRDLTKNWNINIAAELEEYLTELDEITIAFEGETKQLNFAEAALLIQGSACVYSKKVEYLYTLVYQTLDLIAEKRRAAQRTSVLEDGSDADAAFAGVEPAFLALDDTLKEANGIDLVEDETLLRTPSAARSLLPRTPLSLLPADDEGRESDLSRFRLNSALMAANGALVLDWNDKENGDSSAGLSLNTPLAKAGSDASTIILGQKFGSPQALEFDLETIDAHMGDADSDDDSDAGMGGDDGMAEWGGGDGGDWAATDPSGRAGPSVDSFAWLLQPHRGSLHLKATVTTSTTTTSSAAAAAAELDAETDEVDPWAPLDPHACTVTVRPMKRGKTVRKPRVNNALHDVKLPFESNNNVSVPSHKLKRPNYMEFADAFSQELQLRKTYWKKERAAHAGKDTVVTYDLVPGEEDEDGVGLGGVGYAADDGMAERPFGAEGDSDSDDDEGERDPIAPMALVGISEDDIEAGSFEDLCRQHIEKYIEDSARFAQNSDLSRRMNEWTERITPYIEEQDNRTPFDIHDVGDRMLDTLAEEVKPKGRRKKPRDDPIPFRDVVASAPQYEVCRMFLATLQLANNGNVEIVGRTDSFGVKLVSTKPAYELQDYRAPSMQA